MPITLKELAQKAEVHPSTISRVANNDPSLRIAPDTRERIEALLRETEYRPNGVARGLKLRQTFVLAVVIPDVTNPFFAALFRGVEDGALSRGYNVLLCNTDGSPDRQRSHLQSLHARRVDGIILASSVLSRSLPRKTSSISESISSSTAGTLLAASAALSRASP